MRNKQKKSPIKHKIKQKTPKNTSGGTTKPHTAQTLPFLAFLAASVTALSKASTHQIKATNLIGSKNNAFAGITSNPSTGHKYFQDGYLLSNSSNGSLLYLSKSLFNVSPITVTIKDQSSSKLNQNIKAVKFINDKILLIAAYGEYRKLIYRALRTDLHPDNERKTFFEMSEYESKRNKGTLQTRFFDTENNQWFGYIESHFPSKKALPTSVGDEGLQLIAVGYGDVFFLSYSAKEQRVQSLAGYKFDTDNHYKLECKYNSWKELPTQGLFLEHAEKTYYLALSFYDKRTLVRLYQLEFDRNTFYGLKIKSANYVEMKTIQGGVCVAKHGFALRGKSSQKDYGFGGVFFRLDSKQLSVHWSTGDEWTGHSSLVNHNKNLPVTIQPVARTSLVVLLSTTYGDHHIFATNEHNQAVLTIYLSAHTSNKGYFYLQKVTERFLVSQAIGPSFKVFEDMSLLSASPIVHKASIAYINSIFYGLCDQNYFLAQKEPGSKDYECQKPTKIYETCRKAAEFTKSCLYCRPEYYLTERDGKVNSMIRSCAKPKKTCKAPEYLNEHLNECYHCQNTFRGCQTCEQGKKACKHCSSGLSLTHTGQCKTCIASRSNPGCTECYFADEHPKCLKCSKGYFLKNEACYKCKTGCEACSSDLKNSCSECSKGYAFSSVYSRECVLCGEGNYIQHNACHKCSSKTHFCNKCDRETGECQSCSDGKKLVKIKDKQYCVPICSTESYLLLSYGHAKCYSCSHRTSYCSTCEDWTGSCKTCKKGYRLSNSTKRCYEECDKDEYFTGQHTRPCADCSSKIQNCQECEDFTGKCKTCKRGYKLDPKTGKCYIQCETGYYWTGEWLNSCRSCSSKVSDCNLCEDRTGACLGCSPPHRYIDYSKRCEDSCPTGYYRYIRRNRTGYGCRACSENTKSGEACNLCEETNGACEGCKEGFKLNADKYCQRNCGDDQYWTGAADNTCANCSEITPACSACTSGEEEGAVTCSSCITGKWLNTTTRKCITACNATGEYLFIEPETLAESCLNCPSNCLKCANQTGDCQECQPGFVLNQETLACEQEEELPPGDTTPDDDIVDGVPAMVMAEFDKVTPAVVVYYDLPVEDASALPEEMHHLEVSLTVEETTHRLEVGEIRVDKECNALIVPFVSGMASDAHVSHGTMVISSKAPQAATSSTEGGDAGTGDDGDENGSNNQNANNNGDNGGRLLESEPEDENEHHHTNEGSTTSSESNNNSDEGDTNTNTTSTPHNENEDNEEHTESTTNGTTMEENTSPTENTSKNKGYLKLPITIKNIDYFKPESLKEVKSNASRLNSLVNLLIPFAAIASLPMAVLMIQLLQMIKLLRVFDMDLPANILVFINQFDNKIFDYLPTWSPKIGSNSTTSSERCKMDPVFYRMNLSCNGLENIGGLLLILGVLALVKIILFLVINLLIEKKSKNGSKKAVSGCEKLAVPFKILDKIFSLRLILHYCLAAQLDIFIGVIPELKFRATVGFPVLFLIAYIVLIPSLYLAIFRIKNITKEKTMIVKALQDYKDDSLLFKLHLPNMLVVFAVFPILAVFLNADQERLMVILSVVFFFIFIANLVARPHKICLVSIVDGLRFGLYSISLVFLSSLVQNQSKSPHYRMSAEESYGYVGFPIVLFMFLSVGAHIVGGIGSIIVAINDYLNPVEQKQPKTSKKRASGQNQAAAGNRQPRQPGNNHQRTPISSKNKKALINKEKELKKRIELEKRYTQELRYYRKLEEKKMKTLVDQNKELENKIQQKQRQAADLEYELGFGKASPYQASPAPAGKEMAKAPVSPYQPATGKKNEAVNDGVFGMKIEGCNLNYPSNVDQGHVNEFAKFMQQDYAAKLGTQAANNYF